MGKKPVEIKKKMPLVDSPMSENQELDPQEVSPKIDDHLKYGRAGNSEMARMRKEMRQQLDEYKNARGKKVTTVTIQPPTPHSPKQHQIMSALITPRLKETWVACGSKFGKALSYQEVIPTPYLGFIEISKIQLGDMVFSEFGEPIEVIGKTDLMYNHRCFEVEFHDGSKIVADADHEWVVHYGEGNDYEIKTTLGIVEDPRPYCFVPEVILTEWLGRVSGYCGKIIAPRIISKIVEVPSRPVCCIRVKNPTSLFLAGRNCIPTHNSLGASGALVVAAPRLRGGFWRWVAPVYSQAKNVGMKYFRDCMPPDYIRVNRSELVIEIPAISASVQFMHGQRPEDLEGVACHGVVLDECSKLSEDVYYSARTTTTQTQGPFLNISTPRGKNWFYKGCMAAKEEMERAAFENRPPTKIFITAATVDNPFVPRHEIEAARKSLPDALFRQYFLAEFVDSATTFPGLRDLVVGAEIVGLEGSAIQQVIASDAATKSVVIGADWAKQEDWTVFVAIDYESKPARIVGYQRFQGRSYTDAIKSLVSFSKKFSSTDVILHDQTGVGVAIDDMLAETSLPYEGITFTNVVKAEMVTKLIQSIEQKRLLFPNIPALLSEMEAYEMSTTKLGSVQFSAPDGQHDDIVTALMLANVALHRYSDTGLFQVHTVEDMKELTGLSSLYYGEDGDEDTQLLGFNPNDYWSPNWGSAK